MNLWRVRHDVADGVSRLGSLDFLSGSPSRGNAARLPLFDEEVSVRVTGAGELEDDVAMPQECHLVIANPPLRGQVVRATRRTRYGTRFSVLFSMPMMASG